MDVAYMTSANTRNGRWLGPYESWETAYAVARATGRKVKSCALVPVKVDERQRGGMEAAAFRDRLNHLNDMGEERMTEYDHPMRLVA